MPNKKEEVPPISWFPGAGLQEKWAKHFLQMQQLKLKEQQVAHAQRMAEEEHRLKEMQAKSANSKKKK